MRSPVDRGYQLDVPALKMSSAIWVSASEAAVRLALKAVGHRVILPERRKRTSRNQILSLETIRELYRYSDVYPVQRRALLAAYGCRPVAVAVDGARKDRVGS